MCEHVLLELAPAIAAGGSPRTQKSIDNGGRTRSVALVSVPLRCRPIPLPRADTPAELIGQEFGDLLIVVALEDLDREPVLAYPAKALKPV